jgi:hypothetical protein
MRASVVCAAMLLLFAGEANGASKVSANEMMPGCRAFIRDDADPVGSPFFREHCAGAVAAIVFTQSGQLRSEGLDLGPVGSRRRPIHRQPTSKAARELL